MNAHPQLGLILAGPLEPVEPPGELAADSIGLALTPTRRIGEVNAPEIERAAPAEAAPARRFALRRAALAFSVLLHVAAAWAIGDRMARGSLDADEPDAISVELVLETPSPAQAAAAAPGADAADDAEPVTVPDFNPTLAMTPPTIDAPQEVAAAPDFEPPAPPAAMLEILAAPPRLHEPEKPAGPAARPAPEKAVKAKAPEPRAAAKPEKPEPVRNAAPAAGKPKEATKPAKAQAATARARPDAAPVKAAKVGKDSASKAAKAGNGGKTAGAATRPAGASAAARAAYSAKLLSHVRRFQRHPGAAGTARLSVTIGRDGGLRGVLLAGGSGNATLDAEALATARRAAPYPRPPEGIGGATLSFAVSIRFAR